MSDSEDQVDWTVFELPSDMTAQSLDRGSSGVSNGASRSLPGRQRPFFAGPVDMDWLSAAAILPGAALKVAIMLCHLGKLGRQTWIPLSNMAVKSFGVSPDAKTRGLAALEGARLVEVRQQQGQSPRVRLLGAEA